MPLVDEPEQALRDPNRAAMVEALLERYARAPNATPARMDNLRAAGRAFERRDEVTGAFPYSLFIEASSHCNLQCRLCPTGNGRLGRAPQHMPLSVYRAVIDQVAPYAFEVHFAFFGEPTLHPHLPALIEYAAARGAATRLMTNGTRITAERARAMVDAGLDRVTVSLDGLDQPSYEAYRRNGEVSDVLKGIKALASARRGRRPWIEVQVLALRTNEEQLPKASRFVAELGADELKIKRASFDLVEQRDEESALLLPNSESLHYYRRDHARPLVHRFAQSANELEACPAMYLEPGIVTASGLTALCCRDPGARHSYGDVRDQSFGANWDGPSMRRLRSDFADHLLRLPICRGCPNLSLSTFQALVTPLARVPEFR